jgi:hypothetical protein
MTKEELLARFTEDTVDLMRSPLTDPMSTRQADMYTAYCRGVDTATSINSGPPPLVSEPFTEEELKMRDRVRAAFKRGRELHVYQKDDGTLTYRTKKSKTLANDYYSTYIGCFLTAKEAIKILPEYL